jgi:hypothetical protein
MFRTLRCVVVLAVLVGCSDAGGAIDDVGAESDAGADVLPDDSSTADVVEEVEAGPPESWSHGPIAIVEYPGAEWNVQERDGDVVAVHASGRVTLVIDPSSSSTDGRYAGVYLEVDGQERHAGDYNGSHVSTFVPDRPYIDQERVDVVADEERLAIEMVEGSLLEMSDAQFTSDEPFRWASQWTIENDGLAVEAHGLYYLLPPMDGCSVSAFDEAGTLLGSEEILASTPPFLRYYEGVRTISLTSPSLGAVSIDTDAAVLQVQVPSYPDTSRFELDFDHSFKDHGQTDVMTRLVVAL